jgi:hypothetical protein
VNVLIAIEVGGKADFLCIFVGLKCPQMAYKLINIFKNDHESLMFDGKLMKGSALP